MTLRRWVHRENLQGGIVLLLGTILIFFLVKDFCAQRSPKFHCGTERWQVKTLTDPEKDQIGGTVMDATIDRLRALPAPDDLHHVPDHRHLPVETTIFRVHALLVAYKQENDEDFHLVLESPETSQSMIAEIPSGACMTKDFAPQVTAEQSWISSTFGKLAGVGKLRHLDKPVSVVITGVGFFDFIHGQTGVAPNGIEIHPVLTIQKEGE